MDHIRKRARAKKRILVLIISMILIFSATTAGTAAYLISKTPSIENEFTPAEVSCEVTEAFDGKIKKDVAVKNTGNVSAYIRAYVVVNFVSDEGKVLAAAPQEGVDFTLTHTASKWVLRPDGFWYYTEKVATGKTTDNLINSVELLADAPDGYYLNVQILASAIQSEPEKVVTEQWGVVLKNGIIESN